MARMPRRRKGSHQNSPTTGASVAPGVPPAPTQPDDEHRRADEASVSQIDARPHLEANGSAKRPRGVFSALAQSTIPAWLQTAVMISLIFGGCCPNVFALEAIVQVEPASGTLITFAQFVLVAFEGFIYHFDSSSRTFLKPRTVPLHRWLVQIVLFFGVSVLNNYTFGFHISVPVHIILRSGGSMTTMVIGWLWGKRYSRVQVLAVILLTLGIMLAAKSDHHGAGETEKSAARRITGLAILFFAQVLAAFMGLYVEATYSKYGNNYREGLFYTHALGLLLFLPLYRSIHAQFQQLLIYPPLPPQPYLPASLNELLTQVPRQVVYLVLNALTQYVCIRGVNILGSIASALTVTIVLNIRKLVSLLLSMWLFGNKLNPGVMVGAAVVFGSGFLYGVESQRQSKLKRRRAKTQ